MLLTLLECLQPITWLIYLLLEDRLGQSERLRRHMRFDFGISRTGHHKQFEQA